MSTNILASRFTRHGIVVNRIEQEKEREGEREEGRGRVITLGG